METSSEKKFRTKTGYCHVLPDKIILSRDGIVGNVAKTVSGNSILRIRVIYGMMACFLLYMAYITYRDGHLLQPLLLLPIAAYLVSVVIRSRHYSATPVIDRSKLKKIVFKKGTPGLTRSRFEVSFEDENGKPRKRLILLPGTMGDGQSESQKAVEIFKQEGLLN